MSFDGTTYRGLDDNVVEDSAAGDQPLDVFVEQAVSSNSRYVQTGYDSASVPLIGDSSSTTLASTDRIYASRNKSKIFTFPLELNYGDTSVTFTMSYTCESEDSAGSGVDLELRVVIPDSTRAGNETRLGSTETSFTSVTTLTDYEGTVDLGGPWLGRTREVWLEVWIQSDLSDDTGSNVTANQIRDNGFSFSTGFSSPAALTTRCLVSDDTGIEYDVLTASSTKATTYPPPASGESDSTVLSVYELWYLQIRGTSVRINRNASVAGSPAAVSLKAQEPVYSLTAIKQFVAARQCYTRPRLVAIGPTGRRANTENVDGQTFYGWSTDSRSEIMMDGVLQNGVAGNDRLVAYMLIAIKTINRTEGLRADVDLTVSFKILDNGDSSWADATTIGTASSSTRSYTFSPASYSDPLYTIEFDSGTVLRDSQIFEGELQPLRSIRVEVPVNTSLNTTRHSRPMEFEYTFTRSVFFNPTAGNFRTNIAGYSVFAKGD
jgi:hypothetical protein